MNNYSDTHVLKIDPVEFLEFEKTEILYRLSGELNYSDEESLHGFESMVHIINQLKPLRDCETKTDDYLRDAIKQLRRSSKFFIVISLLDAVAVDDAYGHAYNSLVQYGNRYLKLNRVPKKIEETSLYILLEEERKQKEPELPALPKRNDRRASKTLKTSCTAEEIDTIRLRLLQLDIVGKISEPDFKYLFTEQSLYPEMVKLCWNGSRPLCHDFLSRVVFKGRNFDYHQVNSCISFKAGRKLDSNDKSKAQWKGEILDQILLFQ